MAFFLLLIKLYNIGVPKKGGNSKMKKFCYLVEAMCGHVGRGNYIPVTFAVRADSGSEAALITRSIPRVKHSNKWAILGVRKVDSEQFDEQLEMNSRDKYLNWREERYDEDDIEITSRIQTMMFDALKEERKSRQPGRRRQLIEKAKFKESLLMIKESYYESCFCD